MTSLKGDVTVTLYVTLPLRPVLLRSPGKPVSALNTVTLDCHPQLIEHFVKMYVFLVYLIVSILDTCDRDRSKIGDDSRKQSSSSKSVGGTYTQQDQECIPRDLVV